MTPTPRDEVLAFATECGMSELQLLALRRMLDGLAAGDSILDADTMYVSLEPTDAVDEPTLDSPAIGSRYAFLGLLGRGGMGEVWRVHDRDLNRVVALKVIRPELLEQKNARMRFVEEAQCTSQLQHPGTVPVHDIGRLTDGRLYFTMREVRGDSMAHVIQELHSASRGGAWGETPRGWTFRRLIDAYLRVCDAVAYAHDRGVVHRDLKPANIMLAEHGEVLVTDWGIAKILGRPTSDFDAVVTDRSVDPAAETRAGTIAGTPAYMPPEQAEGRIDDIDARADVYALGAVLYELMTGRPPQGTYKPIPIHERVWRAPKDGETERVATRTLPVELIQICERAMRDAPAERFAHAGELATVVSAWLDGVTRRDQAREIVRRALTVETAARDLEDRAESLRAQSRRELAGVPLYAPEDAKRAAWAIEDEASELRIEAERLRLRIEHDLHSALRVDPDLVEAHEALARRHLAEHANAERRREDDLALRSEMALEENIERLPADNALRARATRYLRGTGEVTIVTDPPGAQVQLHRFDLRDRRLVPVFDRSFDTTPVLHASLTRGSYVAELRHPDRAVVRYPFEIVRDGNWGGVAPGESEPRPIVLPRHLDANECFVPGGWFVSGGDPDEDDAPAQQLWCEAFVLRRFPVTNREYLAFLNALVEAGREDDALRWVPRERAGAQGESGAMIYGRDGRGRFVLRADSDGDLWDPDWPVVQVDWHGANAFARASGSSWRLPSELEWEKAARGVDGRFYPWGDFLDPSRCAYKDSFDGRPHPMVVDSFPIDESVYGTRGMSGNCEDWCADVFERAGPRTERSRVVIASPAETEAGSRATRGGDWFGTARVARLTFRHAALPSFRAGYLSFRLAIGVDAAMSSHWTIRRVHRVDEPTLAGLTDVLIDCVDSGASVSFMQPFTRERAMAFWRRVADGVERNERALLVAEDAEGVCGTVQLILDLPENQPHRADLAKMLVHRRARRRGLGEALMRAAEQMALECGRTVLVLDAVTDGDAARLYARLGWVRVGDVPRFAMYPDGRFCGTTYFYRDLAQL